MADKYDLRENIRFHHKVVKANWHSEQQRWSLELLITGSEQKTIWARYVVMGTGHYDYEQPLQTVIPGLAQFEGQVVHPQFWLENLDYFDKNVAIIGSGATAVTLLPAMTEKAKSVTMVQRSPGYFLKVPMEIPMDQIIKRWLPSSISHTIIRWKHFILGNLFFQFCHMFPEFSKKILRGEVAKELPPHIPLDPHFRPAYDPWQQRMCITPGGDFFAALRGGKGHIATGRIKTLTNDVITLEGGQQIPADIIITATGLKLRFAGGSDIRVDGEQVVLGEKFMWRGAMIQDVPNMFIMVGYTNASWTLGADATAQLSVRMMKQAGASKTGVMVPTLTDPGAMTEAPMLNLNSTYIKAAISEKMMPKVSTAGPWKARRSYLIDLWHANFGDIVSGLTLRPAIAA